MKQADADGKEVRETNVGESPQLAVEIACRGFALKRFDVESIKNRECEDCLGSIYGGGEKLVLKKLDVKWFCMWTATGSNVMMCDAQSVHNTDDDVRGIMLCV
jgi:hypothetical protein